MSQPQSDLFPSLPPELIKIILKHLPIETTNTIRSVCKSWKHLAETHCISDAIRQHFPGTEAAQMDFKSTAQANLTFRRLLYQQKSILSGNVTRILQYSQVTSWHLSGDSLLWVDQFWTITIEELRSQEPRMSLAAATWSGSLGVEKFMVTVARLTACGRDILVAIQVLDNIDEDSEDEEDFDALALISRKGTVHWCFQLTTSAQNLHVVADTFYYTLWSEEESSSSSLFTRRSVNDASLICDTRLPFKAKSYTKHHTSLNRNKRWVLLTSDDERKFVVDISTGCTVFQSDQDTDFIFSAVEDKAWEVSTDDRDYEGYIVLSECLYDPEAKTFVRKDASCEAQLMDITCWGLDVDHQVFFSIGPIKVIEQEGQPQSEDSKSFGRHTAFVASLEPQHLDVDEDIKTCRHKQMSLPGYPKRRDLEFRLPFTGANGREDVTFQPENGYLLVQKEVFHDSTITLLDFWPPW